uniref:Integrase core domain containing protein n=1 Tax=Solanum tuberosum TaxID=4113 RepID=M1DW18_SOLTU
MKADNALTWNRTIMAVTLGAGFEIDFSRMIIAEIHERAFKASTSYPFPCFIFQLCRDSGVPIWHCDKLIRATGTLDIGLIWDEANVAAPHREPQVDAPSLGADLVNDVEQMPTTEAENVVTDDVSTTEGAVRVIDSTTEGAVTNDMGTTEGDPSVVPTGS